MYCTCRAVLVSGSKHHNHSKGMHFQAQPNVKGNVMGWATAAPRPNCWLQWGGCERCAVISSLPDYQRSNKHGVIDPAFEYQPNCNPNLHALPIVTVQRTVYVRTVQCTCMPFQSLQYNVHLYIIRTYCTCDATLCTVSLSRPKYRVVECTVVCIVSTKYCTVSIRFQLIERIA